MSILLHDQCMWICCLVIGLICHGKQRIDYPGLIRQNHVGTVSSIWLLPHLLFASCLYVSTGLEYRLDDWTEVYMHTSHTCAFGVRKLPVWLDSINVLPDRRKCLNGNVAHDMHVSSTGFIRTLHAKCQIMASFAFAHSQRRRCHVWASTWKSSSAPELQDKFGSCIQKVNRGWFNW